VRHKNAASSTRIFTALLSSTEAGGERQVVRVSPHVLGNFFSVPQGHHPTLPYFEHCSPIIRRHGVRKKQLAEQVTSRWY
jgi:hypothetical protein